LSEEPKKPRKKREKKGKETNSGQLFHTRKHARVTLQMDVEYNIGEQFEKGVSYNISRGGIFIESDKTLPEGETTTLRFVLDAEQAPVEIKGRVAWVRREEGKSLVEHPAGMGVEFIYDDEKSRNLVSGFVRDLFDLLRIMAIAEKHRKDH